MNGREIPVDPRYPIGPVHLKHKLDAATRSALLEEIRVAPEQYRMAVEGLTAAEWDQTYRPGGWTIRQLIHHVPDSHMHAYIRCRLALTEDEPTIKPYPEAAWAELSDTFRTSPEVSLRLLDALHARWLDTLEGLPEEAFSRAVFHPEMKVRLTLDAMIGQYAWHGRHHLAHIRLARRRYGGGSER